MLEYYNWLAWSIVKPQLYVSGSYADISHEVHDCEKVVFNEIHNAKKGNNCRQRRQKKKHIKKQILGGRFWNGTARIFWSSNRTNKSPQKFIANFS